jgi:hypothetical protein
MLNSAVDCIAQELNQFISMKFQTDEDRVILSNLMNLDGSVAVTEKNKIVISVVNIQEDKIAQSSSGKSKGAGVFPPICLNVFLLISVNFDEKLNKEALKFLSAVAAFFQSKKSFTPSDSPSLDSNIEKLIIEIENLDFHQQSNIFSFLGAKYMPSIFYKMRMVVIEEETGDYTPGVISERGMDSSLD